jgi:hypothetical protein
MGQNVADKNLALVITDNADQAVSIPQDIENGDSSDAESLEQAAHVKVNQVFYHLISPGVF